MTTAARAETASDGRVAWAFAALVAGAFAMGASPIFVRLADIGPFASAFWRVALALPALWAWDRFEAGREPGVAPFWTRPVLLAGLFFAGDLFFWHLSILNTMVANATFFATTAPVWVVLASWLLLGHRIAGATLIGLALCLAGGGALLWESLDIDPARVIGDLYGLVTAIFFGAYFLAVGAARRRQSAARITFASSLVTAIVLLGVALASEPVLWPSSAQGIGALVALALVSHAGGQGLLAFALGHLPATFSSLVIFLEAICAAALGWILLGEALSLVQALGGLLILLGIWVARPRRTAVSERRL